MKSRTVKIISLTLTALVIMAALYMGYLYLRFHQAVPDFKGVKKLSGLHHDVAVTQDAMGIPQIWAEDEHDVYMALGYIHASERLFQMDMTRRVAQGRLSELLGASVLNIDLHQRVVGHSRIAQKVLPTLNDTIKEYLSAYARGVNQWLEQADALPFEYQLLSTDFEPWSVYDAITVLSFQTWFSDFLMSPDDMLAHLSLKLGSDTARTLNTPYPSWAPTVVTTQKESPAAKLLAKTWFAPDRLPFLMSNSSNSWVVSPALSQTGGAMLASDPHLEVRRLPQFWYVVGLHAQQSRLNVVGITTPGLPVVIMGHNDHSAWAFTVSGVDVNDYYVEKQHPSDTTRYLTPDGWQKLKRYPQNVKIAGREQPLRFTVLETRHGPVVFENDSLKRLYALHWAGYDVDLNKGLKSMFNLMKIDSYDQFRITVSSLGALDASWTYADRQGNIGYQLGTPIPLRPKNPHNTPVPGWIRDYDWQGFVPLEKTPHQLNPDKGWIATCNNKPQTSTDIPLYGNFYSDRILRIEQLLNSKNRFTVQDMYRFQMDITDAYLASHWKDEIVKLLNENGYASQAQRLAAWDGSTRADSYCAALINVFLEQLKINIFSDELGQLVHKIQKSDLERIYFHGPDYWFDRQNTRDKKESRAEIIRVSLEQALRLTEGKTWGDFHRLRMAHPLSAVALLDMLLPLSFGPYPWSGTEGTLNAAFYLPEPGEEAAQQVVVGPSWRFVIDFSQPDSATMVIPAGNSGHPYSEHYMDFFSWWKGGKRWTVPLSRKAVLARAVNKMVFKP